MQWQKWNSMKARHKCSQGREGQTYAGQLSTNLAVKEETPSPLQEAAVDQVKVVLKSEVIKPLGRCQFILINLYFLLELWVPTSLWGHQIDFPSMPLVGTTVNNKSSSFRKTQWWLKENAFPRKDVHCLQQVYRVIHWSRVSQTPADAQEGFVN